MTDLPSLGVGLVYAPGLEAVIEAGSSKIDVLEIEPQTMWFKTGSAPDGYRIDYSALDRIKEYPQRKLIHGVGFPVGGTQAPLTDQLTAYIETIVAVEAPWASEHLSFNQAKQGSDTFNTGFLLPPLQTTDGARMAAENICELKSQLPVPFAFETGVNYLKPRKGEISDGAFFAEVAEAADCGILLDLHNLWANQRNGRQPVLEALSEMPLERVWEVHLAGGDEHRGYWLDAHSGLVPDELMDLASTVISKLPNIKALIFEIISDYIPANQLQTEDLVEQISAMRKIWQLRGSQAANNSYHRSPGSEHKTPSDKSPREWESELASLVVGRETHSGLAAELRKDFGVELYKELVTAVRGGMAVSTLRLTCRMLRLHLGEDQFRQVLETFWLRQTPEQFSSEEAKKFANFLKKEPVDVPHIFEVLNFELAVHRAQIEDCPQEVDFTCEPMSLLKGLQAGHVPKELDHASYKLIIDLGNKHSPFSQVKRCV